MPKPRYHQLEARANSANSANNTITDAVARMGNEISATVYKCCTPAKVLHIIFCSQTTILRRVVTEHHLSRSGVFVLSNALCALSLTSLFLPRALWHSGNQDSPLLPCCSSESWRNGKAARERDNHLAQPSGRIFQPQALPRRADLTEVERDANTKPRAST